MYLIVSKKGDMFILYFYDLADDTRMTGRDRTVDGFLIVDEEKERPC